MLGTHLEHNRVQIQDPFKEKEKKTIIAEIVHCETCRNEAFIFQTEGNYCLICWQERTEPNITIRGKSEFT